MTAPNPFTPQQQPQGQQFAPQGAQPQQFAPQGAQPQQFAPQGAQLGAGPQGSQFAPQGQQPQFGGQPGSPNPFDPQGQQPQGQQGFAPQPQAAQPQGFAAPQGQQFAPQQPQGQQFAPQGQQAGGDPFAQLPDAPPAIGTLDKALAVENAVLAIYPTAYEKNVLSKFPDPKTNQPQYQDRLHVNAIIITGSRAGERVSDAHIYWSRIARQFENSIGAGPFLIQLGQDGNAVIAAPVNDPQLRAHAATMI